MLANRPTFARIQARGMYEKIRNARAKHSDSNTGITIDDMLRTSDSRVTAGQLRS